MEISFGWPKIRCPRRIEFLNLFVKILKKHKLQDTPGISNPRIVGGESTATKSLYEVQVEGTNFGLLQTLQETCVNFDKIMCNDVKSVFRFFGIEAARAVIIRELTRVFSVYGITVDFRHMSLVADSMTHSGMIKAFNRTGISTHSSPLLQMSFETSMNFLSGAVERGATDDLHSPSGSLVTGKMAALGTGICKAIPHLVVAKKTQSPRKKRKTNPTNNAR
eukprot:GHVO01065103.1.p1 GENE.GHVO01065103.1~~GHVO01065103.1.p1  ORF type:complete len:253 (+),score=40.58 GHVO01065103.1:99-761(+)